MVGVALVDKPPPRNRYRDHTGFAALETMRINAEAAITIRHPRHRHPGARAAAAFIDRTAGRHRHAQSIAGVTRCRQGIVLALCRRVRIEALAQLRVVRKTTGGAHHSPARADGDAAPLAHHERPDYAAFAQAKTRRGRAQPQGNTKIKRGLGQARNECVAAHQQHVTAVQQNIGGMLADAPCHVQGRSHRTQGVGKMPEVRARTNLQTKQCEFTHRRPQLRQSRPQRTAVEGRRANGAPARQRTGLFGVVVRIVASKQKRHRRFTFEERHHARAIFKKCVDALRVIRCADFRLEVGACGIARVGDTGPLCRRVARNPQPPAGQGRGAAKAGLLLDHQHIKAKLARGNGRGKTAGTAADHQHITFELFVVPDPAHVALDGHFKRQGYGACPQERGGHAQRASDRNKRQALRD